MFYVNKIVGWILSPLGILFLGLAAGLLLARTARFRTAGRTVCVLTLALTWTLGCGITTRLIGVPLEGEETDICELPAESFGQLDAIVLLGGGMGYHSRCGRAEMFSGADRAWTAARLWKKLRVPITVSGGGLAAERAFLLECGVAPTAVIEVQKARNTEEEARLIAEKLSPKPKVLLVTSAWHMPRAAMLFRRAGFEVVPAPADFEMTYAREAELGIADFFPNAEALLRNSAAVKEWVARFCYWLIVV